MWASIQGIGARNMDTYYGSDSVGYEFITHSTAAQSSRSCCEQEHFQDAGKLSGHV